MQIAVIGLGKMGGGIVRRLAQQGIKCVAQDADSGRRAAIEAAGGRWAGSIKEAVAALPRDPSTPRKVVWVMVPAGQVTRDVIRECAQCLEPGDIIIDGGNSLYKDSVAMGQELAAQQLAFVDSGTSGGLRGEQIGYCLMVGGQSTDIAYLRPVFDKLRAGTPEHPGFVHCGPVGSGHFVKMVQNGIEYGMMQSLAEGFHLMQRADLAAQDFSLDLGAIAQAWRQGSVVQSWLLDLLAQALTEDAQLSDFSGVVPDSGTGRWTINAALETSTPAHVLTAALMQRFQSRLEQPFGQQVLSALRAGFGGHTEEQLYQPDERT